MNEAPADAPELSIVVPAYNEQARLPSTLAAILNWRSTSGHRVELIVVDDGSSDATREVAIRALAGACCACVLSVPHRGKASAVRDGVMAARGKYILFTDADLSTPIQYAATLVAALEQGADVAIGSREGVGSRRVGEPYYRHLMGRAYNLLVRALAVPGIQDTQCGFKAFRRDAARDIFTRTRLYTGGKTVRGPRVTGFDVELLFIARRGGYSMVEIPVYWRHVPGSKVRPGADSIRMLGDVLRVRWNALLGRYGRR